MLPPEALRTNRFERGRAGTPARPLFVCIAVATYYSSPAKAGKKLTGTWLHARQTRLSRYEAGEHRRRAVRPPRRRSLSLARKRCPRPRPPPRLVRGGSSEKRR